jgi:hypothetical protein
MSANNIKKGKELRSEDAELATHHSLSPHCCRLAPHHHRHWKHEQGQCQRQPTRQESMRRRGRGRWEDRYIRKCQEGLIPLAVNDLLIAPHNLKALIQLIDALICALARDKDTSEHLQDARVGTRRGGGTTTVCSVGRSSSSSSSGRTSTRSPWILGHYGVK